MKTPHIYKSLLLVVMVVFCAQVPMQVSAKEKVALVIERPPIKGGSADDHFIALRPMATKPKKSYTFEFLVDGQPVSQTLSGNLVFNLRFKNEVIVLGCGDKCGVKTVTNYLKKEVNLKKDKDENGNRIFRITPR